MIRPEMRMLLRHYLEQAANKSELACQLWISRETPVFVTRKYWRSGSVLRALDKPCEACLVA